jgi:aminoglycoside 3-N-acetyltransferase
MIAAPIFSYACTRFNPETEPSLTGTITEAVRQWPGAVRSWHPTHSWAMIGPRAAEFADGHHLIGGVSFGSPLDRIVQSGGKVLLLGIGHAANTTIHVGETHERVPYVDVPFFADSPTGAVVVIDGEEIPVALIDPSGCSRTFGVVEYVLRQKGAIQDGKIGAAVSQLMLGMDVIEATREILAVNPAGLLCNDPTCHRCAQGRLKVAKTKTAAT